MVPSHLLYFFFSNAFIYIYFLKILSLFGKDNFTIDEDILEGPRLPLNTGENQAPAASRLFGVRVFDLGLTVPEVTHLV